MIVFVCIDDNNGLMFNNRRQSRDISILESIKQTIGDNYVCVSVCSEPLFKRAGVKCIPVFDPIKTMLLFPYRFVENTPIDLNNNEIEKIVVYKWNRKYPGDVFFDYETLKNNFNLISTGQLPRPSTPWVHGRVL